MLRPDSRLHCGSRRRPAGRDPEVECCRDLALRGEPLFRESGFLSAPGDGLRLLPEPGRTGGRRLNDGDHALPSPGNDSRRVESAQVMAVARMRSEPHCPGALSVRTTPRRALRRACPRVPDGPRSRPRSPSGKGRAKHPARLLSTVGVPAVAPMAHATARIVAQPTRGQEASSEVPVEPPVRASQWFLRVVRSMRNLPRCGTYRGIPAAASRMENRKCESKKRKRNGKRNFPLPLLLQQQRREPSKEI